MFLQRLLGLCVLVCGGQQVAAQQWNGAVDTTFNNVANWTAGTLPPNDGTAAITLTGSFAPTIDAAWDVRSLTFDASLTNSFTLAAVPLATLTVRDFIAQNSGWHQTISAPLTLGGTGPFIFKGTGDGTLELTGKLTGAAGFVVTENANVRVAGEWNVAGGLTVQSGGRLEFSGGNITLANAIANSGEVSFGDAGQPVAYSGSLSGAGGVHLGGTVTFGAANTYSGSTYFGTGATLTDGAAGVYSPNSAMHLYGDGASLQVNHGQTIAGLEGAGNTTVNLTGNLTILGGDSEYFGTIAGTGGLILDGAGFQRIAGNNTYSGGTLIQAGTLMATNVAGSATGTGDITIASGARLQLGNQDASGAVSGNIINHGTLFVARTDAYSLDSLISGNGNLSVGFLNGVGTGDITLTQANTYTGQTQVSAGTLRVGVANALPTTTSVGLNSGARLEIAHDQQIERFFQTHGSALAINAGATLRIAPDVGAYGGTLESTISGGGALVFAGTGGSALTIHASNTYSGGTTIESGTLYVAQDGALGTGTVTVAANAGLLTGKDAYDVTLSNAVVVGQGASLGGSDEGLLTLTGNVTLPSGAGNVRIHDVVHFAGLLQATNANSELWLESGSDSLGRAVLSSTLGANISVIRVDGAGVIFGTVESVPSSASVSIKGTNGYVGVMQLADTAPSVASVLSLIDQANFTGTLGLDTPADDTPWTVFAQDIDLSTFSGLSVGSSTAAKLTGNLIPSSSGYLLGNGGGALAIASALTGAHGLTVSSTTAVPNNQLIAILQGNNTFTGPVSVSNSALVLDAAAALPAGRTVTLAGTSYLGYTENFTGAEGFLDFISTRLVPGGYSATSILGLDSAAYVSEIISTGHGSSRRVVTEDIDMRGLSSIGLGTLTKLELNGQIHAPAQGGAGKTLTLVPLEDGEIMVHSDLAAGQVDRVVIGSPATGEEGVVLLTGANTYAGGTTLEAGTLVVAGSSHVSADGRSHGPLGTGTLTIANTAKDARLASSSGSFLKNAISLLGNLTLGFEETIESALEETSSYDWLSLDGAISGAGGLNVVGSVDLNGANSFTGGVFLRDGGELGLGSDTALGTGALTFLPGDGPSSSYYLWAYEDRVLANPLIYSGSSGGQLTVQGAETFTFNGTLTLNNDLEVNSYGSGGAVRQVRFNGGIGGFGRLTFTGPNQYHIGGTANNPSRGIAAGDGGMVVFTNPGSLPTQPGSLFAETGGYIGIQFVPGDLQSDFLSRFDKFQNQGAIGFDSTSAGSPNTFSQAIDLTGFNSSTRLGSASRAILTGTITPTWNVYRFGNGGGYLDVRSNLDHADGGRSIAVESDFDLPLTVRLGGSNTFAGGGYVYRSGLIFGSNSLPATGEFNVVDGYIGTEAASFGTAPQAFVDRLDPLSLDAVIGFEGMTVTGAIDLTRFTETNPNIFLGTSTTATLQSSITLPATQNAYLFAGYKGGHLTVNTLLADGNGARGVTIGNGGIDATWLDPVTGAVSAVTLAGANTYSGGTQLAAGILYVANDQALGTGTVTVGTTSVIPGQSPALLTAGGARSLANPISIGWVGLNVGGTDNLTLSGVLSGDGGLNKVGTGMLTLSGANSGFGSWIDVESGGVTFTTGASIGTAELILSGPGATATFLDSTTVQGLYAYDANTTVNLTAGETLSIYQPSSYGSATFAGSFAGSTAGLNFLGGSTRLSGASTFSGPVTLQDSVVVAAHNQAFGASSNVVTVNSAHLAVNAGTVLQNPVALNGGTLAGSGTFKAAAGGSGFNLGSGAYVSPGMQGAGTLTFDGSLISTSVLILNGGGTYVWELHDAAAANGADQIVVNGTVNIAATAGNAFNFKFGTVDVTGQGGLAANFDPTQAYSWTVLTATSITGFAGADQFNLIPYNFHNHAGIGVFSLSLNASGDSLMLNFNPVPEPSTYAMMLTGLGAIAWVYRRKKAGKRT